MGYWYYLRILWLGDGVSQKYLSDQTNVAENTTASIISSMVQEGLVTRERDKRDKRKFRINLTERGRELEGELLHYAARINEKARQGIDDDEVIACMSTLKRMSENLEEEFKRMQESKSLS
ncbi:hypothetical protein GCM10023208_06880 [Erythrobacter westpacificensis]|uniref:HTH marR-type domain-containing protein n=1 Tax=Erythrobacter westpacificensis TaxID=1055231 RepID=A0ABP9K0Z6_9SPHN